MIYMISMLLLSVCGKHGIHWTTGYRDLIGEYARDSASIASLLKLKASIELHTSKTFGVDTF